MAAANEFLIDLFVTGFAIAGCHLGGKREAVVFFFGLSGRGLMTIEAGHALGGVLAHLEFMDDRVLLAGMAFGAFAGGADEIGGGLVEFTTRPGAVNQESSENQREGDDERSEKQNETTCGPPRRIGRALQRIAWES
jgi:hypothetical protein